MCVAESFFLLAEETEIVSRSAFGSTGEEWMGALQHTPFNIFLARDPGPDAQTARGVAGPLQHSLCRALVVAVGTAVSPALRCGPRQGELAPRAAGLWSPLRWAPQGSQPGQCPVPGAGGVDCPAGVEEAAPALPWPQRGQAATGWALKCEAASLRHRRG